MSCERFRSFPWEWAKAFLSNCPRVGLIAIFALVSFAFSGSAPAASVPVLGIGPGITNINEMVIDPSHPSIIYAATDAGVYKSVDGGGTWADSSNGIFPPAGYLYALEPPVVSIAIDPAHPNILYTVAGDIYKSTDSGNYWTPISTSELRESINTKILVDPFNPTNIYLGTRGGTLCCGEWGRVYKSTDGGASWASTGDIGAIYTLAADPIHPDTLYADACESYTCEMYKSIDGGASWITATAGLPISHAVDLAIAPDNADILYAAVDYHGVFKSIDGGASWITSTTGITSSVYSLEIDPLVPATLYAGTRAGVYKTTDGAGTWNLIQADASLRNVTAFAIDQTAHATLYAGTGTGEWPQTYYGNAVYKSSDAGENWSLAASGLPNAISSVGALELDSNQPANLFAHTFLGLLQTNDYGEHWAPAFPHFPLEYGIMSLAFDPANPMTIYAGTHGGGIYKSLDGGEHWVPVNTGLTTTWVGLLVIDPKQPDTVYASGGGSLYRTADGGEHWQAIYTLPDPNSWIGILVLNPVAPTTIYLGIGRGIAKTTDSGNHWSNLPLPIPAKSNAVVQALAIDPANPSILYAGTGQLLGNLEQEKGAIYKSKNGGRRWVSVTKGLPAGSIWSLAIDPLHPKILYTGISNSLYQTTTRGASWHPIAGYSRLNGGFIYALRFDPRDTRKLYIGSDRGVFLVGERRFTIFLPFNTR